MPGRDDNGLDTLLVGLDGASLPVLRPLFDAGVTPTLRDLFGEGASGPLRSQIPPWTASAWPSLYTGTNPGKHGVFGFLAFEGYDWEVVTASSVEERPLWGYLDHHDLTSVVVNVPVTYPPEAVDGAVVPGYLAPEDPPCHPEGILEDVRDHLGEYRVYADVESDESAGVEETVAEYRALTRMRGEAFRYLADRFDPDFGFLQFQHTDTILHEYPETDRAVRGVYGAVDGAVDRTLAACDPETVVVVSDHGLGEYDRRLRVNEVLRDEGLLSATRGGEGMPTWAVIRDDRLREGERGEGTDGTPLQRTAALAASVGLTSQRAGAVLERLGLLDAARRWVPTGLVRAGSEQVDFPNSAAYARSRVECGIRINLRGREPDGVVAPGEYEAVRSEVVELLSDLTTPEGDPVFETVAPREEFFSGPNVDRAVDVVAVPRRFDTYVTTWLLGEHFAAPDPPAWDHEREGVVAATGAGVDQSADLSGAHLFDVAPTVLALLGLKRAERMDGDVLPVAEDPGATDYPDYDVGAGTTLDDEAVEERLADLGYVE
ncbi:phosphodiesterase [Halobacteriales archaeon QS_8_69_26]|nr:MAG: phosphodiesterase [Halobacteriales archaeon QS_8_69_26]